jgi:hypothetical protein
MRNFQIPGEDYRRKYAKIKERYRRLCSPFLSSETAWPPVSLLSRPGETTGRTTRTANPNPPLQTTYVGIYENLCLRQPDANDAVRMPMLVARNGGDGFVHTQQIARRSDRTGAVALQKTEKAGDRCSECCGCLCVLEKREGRVAMNA